MQLSDFFSADISSIISSKTVILFKGDSEYPLLFFTHFLAHMRRHSEHNIERLDLIELDHAMVQVKLETSFLGMCTVFLLGGFDHLDEKRKKNWFSYFSSYSGPNIVLVYVQTDEVPSNLEHLEHIDRVIMPTMVDQSYLVHMLQWFGVRSSQAGLAMFSRLFKRYPQINFEKACLVMRYVPMVSSGAAQELDNMIDIIIGSEQSLFTLSTHFFARQQDQFFALWATMHDQYPDVFWITFWSETMWRALCYVRYAKERNMLEAKKIAYRLPFSFMQRDWKLHDEQKFVSAHQFLYEADFQLKNGNEAPLIELFYCKFFENSW